MRGRAARWVSESDLATGWMSESSAVEYWHKLSVLELLHGMN